MTAARTHTRPGRRRARGFRRRPPSARARRRWPVMTADLPDLRTPSSENRRHPSSAGFPSLTSPLETQAGA